MPGENQASRRRRAVWTGLRTLRRIPREVGETDGGDPIFSVDGIRLVLRSTSHHFRRLDSCTRCGNETVGSPIVTKRDLFRSGHPVVCKECVESAHAGEDEAGNGKADDRFDFDDR